MSDWQKDDDGWFCRPLRPADASLPRECAGSDFIGTGTNAFVDHGMIYCRDEQQAAQLDAGKPV